MAQQAHRVGPTGRTRPRPAGGHVTGRSPAGRDGDSPQPAGLGKAELAALRERLRRVVEPVVVGEGLDLEELSVSRMGRRYVVRVTVDADGGVGHDDLSDVSRAVSVALDQAEQRAGELTPGSYTLEVSSPGVDRPLTQPRHWHRNVGRRVSVRVAGRQVTGRIAATTMHGVSLDVDGRRLDATFDELGPGRVQVEFTRLAELTDEEFGPELSDELPDDRED
jgi:ribosome maturation factor RimP